MGFCVGGLGVCYLGFQVLDVLLFLVQGVLGVGSEGVAGEDGFHLCVEGSGCGGDVYARL